MTTSRAWPTATLDPVRRARALAAAMPSAALAEATLDSPFAQAWSWIADLSASVPVFDHDVTGIHIRTRSLLADGAEQLTATVRSHGVPWPFRVRLEPGFCLMQARARLYTVIMAAAPEPDDPSRTRFVHVEAVPLPGTAKLRPFIARLVRADLAALRRLSRDSFGEPR